MKRPLRYSQIIVFSLIYFYVLFFSIGQTRGKPDHAVNSGTILFRGFSNQLINKNSHQSSLYAIQWKNDKHLCTQLSTSKEKVTRIYRYSNNKTNKIQGVSQIADNYYIRTYLSSETTSYKLNDIKYQNMPPGLLSGSKNNLILASSILKPRYGQRNVSYSDIFSLNLESGVLDQLTYQGQNLAPAVSPDGKWIIFYSFPEKDMTNDATDTQDSTDFNLILMGTKDRKSVILDSSIYRLHDFWDKPPVWSPDGNKILFHKKITPDTPPRLFILDIATKNAKELSDITLCPSWSPDGTELAYSQLFGREGSELHSRNITTNKDSLLAGKPGFNEKPF